MARQCKEGIDYFPLNIDMDEEDERVFMMEAKFGERGFAVLIKLLMTIYRNGYYYRWTEREQVFFSRKKNIDLDYCRSIVDFLLLNGFFCRKLFDKFQILTSRGIQKRYFPACIKRKKVLVIKEFLLLDLDKEISDSINLVLVGINHLNSGGLPEDTGRNEEKDGSYSQTRRDETRRDESKVNESKVNESKREETRGEGNECSPSASPGVNTPSKKPTPNNQSRDGPLDTNQFGPDGKKLLSPEDVRQEKDRQKRALKGKYPDEFSDEELEVLPLFPEAKARGSPGEP